MSECQSVRVSECQSVRMSECQSVRVSECQSVRMSECQSVRVSEWWGWGELGVRGVRIIQNVHIYKNGHNWGRKWVPRHDSGGIRKEI